MELLDSWVSRWCLPQKRDKLRPICPPRSFPSFCQRPRRGQWSREGIIPKKHRWDRGVESKKRTKDRTADMERRDLHLCFFSGSQPEAVRPLWLSGVSNFPAAPVGSRAQQSFFPARLHSLANFPHWSACIAAIWLITELQKLQKSHCSQALSYLKFLKFYQEEINRLLRAHKNDKLIWMSFRLWFQFKYFILPLSDTGN